MDADGRTVVNDASEYPEMNVFMVMENDGDYEVRYANPKLKTSTGKSRKTAVEIRFYRHSIAPVKSIFAAGGIPTEVYPSGNV